MKGHCKLNIPKPSHSMMNFPEGMGAPIGFLPAQDTSCQATMRCSLQGWVVLKLPGVIKLSNPFPKPQQPDKLIVRCWNQQVSKGFRVNPLYLLQCYCSCSWIYLCSTSAAWCHPVLLDFKSRKRMFTLVWPVQSINRRQIGLQQTRVLCVPKKKLFLIIHCFICHETMNPHYCWSTRQGKKKPTLKYNFKSLNLLMWGWKSWNWKKLNTYRQIHNTESCIYLSYQIINQHCEKDEVVFLALVNKGILECKIFKKRLSWLLFQYSFLWASILQRK